MSALLVLTVGQTDVQLVEDGIRRELRNEKCGKGEKRAEPEKYASLHDEIERRDGEWRLVDSPRKKDKPYAKKLPDGSFALCTPKLDAVLQYAEENRIKLTAALILETRRDPRKELDDPIFAGTILARRLRDHGVANVQQVAFLTGEERLQGWDDPRDSIIRREVVARIDGAIHRCLQEIQPDHVLISATGGFPGVSRLVDEIVRLYADPAKEVDLLEVPDGAQAKSPAGDRAVSRKRVPEPAASYQARRHALDLIEKGNLLGAWGAVQHLHDDAVERRWARVVEWLACFAASRPMPPECDIPILTHRRMAVRTALRVELALRAEDVPRAVHGTVAFFESAFWDWLKEYDFAAKGVRKIGDKEYQLPSQTAESLEKRFRKNKNKNGTWRIDDRPSGINAWLQPPKRPSLTAFWKALTDDIRDLRNDVAHSEPSDALMHNARHRMTEAELWSAGDRFLTQPLVKNVLLELGVQDPDRLCTDLMSSVRARLLEPHPA